MPFARALFMDIAHQGFDPLDEVAARKEVGLRRA